VTRCKGFERFGLGGSLLAFHFFTVLEVLEHITFAPGDEAFFEERLERIEDGGSGECLEPAFGHGGGVLGFGVPEHDADSEDEEFVAVEVMLGEHPSVNFEYVGFLHKFGC